MTPPSTLASRLREARLEAGQTQHELATLIGDPNDADALCDRLLHNPRRIELKGPTMRNTKNLPKAEMNPESWTVL